MDVPPFNPNGGLTLVPMPGFEILADQVLWKIESLEGQSIRKTRVDIVTPQFGLRSSGEPYVRLGKDHIGGHDIVVLTSGPATYEMQVKLYLVLRYLAGRRSRRVTVVSGYFPFGRSDKDEGSEEFALPPFIIDLMQEACTGPDRKTKLNRIIAVDLHAPQVVMSGKTGLVTEMTLVRRILKQVILEAKQTGLSVVWAFPDGSAAKRAAKGLQKATKELNVGPLPAVFCIAKIELPASSVGSMTYQVLLTRLMELWW